LALARSRALVPAVAEEFNHSTGLVQGMGRFADGQAEKNEVRFSKPQRGRWAPAPPGYSLDGPQALGILPEWYLLDLYS
jgi:hypothetical protein